jgi:hypothetical protein
VTHRKRYKNRNANKKRMERERDKETINREIRGNKKRIKKEIKWDIGTERQEWDRDRERCIKQKVNGKRERKVMGQGNRYR